MCWAVAPNLFIFLKEYLSLCPFVSQNIRQTFSFLKLKRKHYFRPSSSPSPSWKKKTAYYRVGKLQNVWLADLQKWKYRCFQIFWMKHKVPFKIPGAFAIASCQNSWGNTFLLLHCWSNLPNHMALFSSLSESVEGLYGDKTICGVRQRVRILSGTVRGTRFLIFLNSRIVNPVILTFLIRRLSNCKKPPALINLLISCLGPAEQWIQETPF